MPSGRSHNSGSRTRYRTHDRDELLAAVLEETGEAAEREHLYITQEFERRKRERIARRRNQEDQRLREITDARRRETERQERAKLRRNKVLREIEEDDLRLSGQWPPVDKSFVGPFDTSEFGACAAVPTTDEWVVSELTMESVERRLGLRRLSGNRRKATKWLVAGAVAAVVLAVASFVGTSSSRLDLDPTEYPINALTLVEVDHPTSIANFRAPAPAVSRRHSAESNRSIHAAVNGSPQSIRSESRQEPSIEAAEPTRNQSQPLNIDLGDAENLWDRGSE